MFEIKQAKNKVQWFLMYNECIVGVFYSIERAMEEMGKAVKEKKEGDR